MTKLLKIAKLYALLSLLVAYKTSGQSSQFRTYQIKSGLIQYFHSSFISKDSVTLQFDEYGLNVKFSIISKYISNYIYIVMIDSVQYYYIAGDNQVIKSKRSNQLSFTNLNLVNFPSVDSTLLVNGAPTDTLILGLRCQKYFISDKRRNINCEVSLWNNIPLLIVTDTDEGRQILEATKVDIHPLLSKQIFEIPTNAEIIDITK